MFWNQYPYNNLNDLNLDYLLNKLKELEQRLVDFIKINTIKYADPIQWNITTQYEANTVVIDGNSGTAYLSTQPVPSGIALTNADYWTVIFTLDILSANQNITFRNDGSNVLATFTSVENDWLLWNGNLYKVIRPIAINEAYVSGYNIQRYSVELFIREYMNNIATTIGDLDDLNTTIKNEIVGAINEVNDNVNTLDGSIGDLSELDTSDKSNLVNAINEVNQNTARASVPYIESNFSDIQIGDYLYANGYSAEFDGANGYWERVNAAIPGVTYDHNGAYYKPIPDNGFVNVKMFGVIGGVDTEPTITNNRNVINALIAAGVYHGLVIPPDVNYGYDSHVSNLIQLNTLTSPIKIVIADYSVDNSYPDAEAKGAAIKRLIFGTPNNTGQNDGNGLIVTGANHPYVSIINNDERPESQRASILFGSRDSDATGVYNWQISQCYFAQDKVLSIVKYYYDEDLQTRTSHCFIAMDYATHNMAIGYGAPKFGLHLHEVFPTIVGTNHGTIFHYLNRVSSWTERLDCNYENDTISFSDLNNKRLEYTIPTGLIRHTNPAENVNQIIQFAPNSTGNALAVRNYASANEVFTINSVGSGKFRLGVSGGAFTTANRPSGVETGAMIFDTTLHKPIWYDGSNWRDATGAIV